MNMICAIPLFLASVAVGQPGGGGTARPWRITFTPAVEYALPADLRTTTGDVSVFRVGAGLGVSAPIGEMSSLGVNLAWQRSWYEWDKATAFGGTNEPWDDVNELDLGVRYMSRVDEKWSWFAGVGVNSSGEDGADFGDTLTFGGGGGVRYQVSETLGLTGGVIVRSQLEDNASVIPIVGVDWTIDDRWSLTTDYRTSIFPRPGVFVKYKASEDVTVALGASYETKAFRLSDRDTPADGIGREWRLPVELNAQWKVSAHGTLSATVGLVAWQRYRMDDAAGVRIAQFETDPTMSFGLSFTLAY